ncbi:MAG TPA: hypothetical protein VMK42_11600 [Anaeromyxobacteraceae bacterium]|nr:hypothetical protein [Anaeromyxobacteraceae bacterium]
MLYSARMELPPDAARALELVRRNGRDVRFEIKKACEQERWRLKVCYHTGATGSEEGEVQLGLLWSEDLTGLEGLLRRLEDDGR